MEQIQVRELGLGVDAVYVSGRAHLSDSLIDRLNEARQSAQAIESAVDFEFGGQSFQVQSFGVLKYRFRMDHPNGIIGISPGGHLPTFFVQPRAEFIHSLGPAEAVRWFRDVLEAECKFVQLSVRRADLFADFRGWLSDATRRSRSRKS